MSLDRSLIADVRSLSDPELRRLVILAQDLLERRGAGRVPEGAKITYRREEVRCGKANCTRCPHGPYWYAYWREDGRLRSSYLGSAKAGELHQPPPTHTRERHQPPPTHTREPHQPPPTHTRGPHQPPPTQTAASPDETVPAADTSVEP